MATITVPEIILLDAINSTLKGIRKDYADKADKTKTWLYRSFNGIKIDRYDLYKEIVAIVCKEEDDTRFFGGDLMFNPKKNNVPAFHITLPSESPADGNTIGMGAGAYDNFQDYTMDVDTIVSIDEAEVFSRQTQTNYSIVIMSDNSMEVVLLYHLMRAIVMINHVKLADAGIINLSFGGQDLQPYKEVAPQLYMRSLSVGFQYTTGAIALDPISYLNDVETQGTAVALVD